MSRFNKYPPSPDSAHKVTNVVDSDHEIINIIPGIGFETLKSVGFDTLRTDWAVESLSPDTTLVRRANTLNISVQQAAIRLTIGLARDTGRSAVFYPC